MKTFKEQAGKTGPSSSLFSDLANMNLGKKKHSKMLKYIQSVMTSTVGKMTPKKPLTTAVVYGIWSCSSSSEAYRLTGRPSIDISIPQ